MSVDPTNDTLARLKGASDALDAAQKASRTTSRELARTQRNVAKAKKKTWATNSVKVRRRAKPFP